MNVRYVIFDFDGTLIDSSAGVVEAVNYALRHVGERERAPEEIRPYIGYPLEMMFADMTDAPVSDLRRLFQERAVESVVDSAVPLDGAERTVAELHRRGYGLAIATTKIRFHVDAILAKFGWTPLFRAAAAGNEVPRVKPEPDILHLALRRLSATAEETLVVGDTINDVLAAQAVPMPVAAVRSPYGGHEKVAALKPDYELESVVGLLNILNGHHRPGDGGHKP